MLAPERTYSLLTFGALALALLVAFVALVHSFAETQWLW
jgi:hypothetical protein